MILHAHYEYSTENRDEVHRRFKDTGGVPPPEVTMLGRWHSAEGNRGFLIAESDDTNGIARWLNEWTDLVSFEVTPVLTDEEFIQVIS